jgi:hypothetical protein
MRMMEITTELVLLCDKRWTGLLYILLEGREYQLFLADEYLPRKLLFRASLIAMVNSGWFKNPGDKSKHFPAESYVLQLPLLTKDDYEYEPVEEYFLKAPPTNGNRIGVTKQEYLDVQIDVLGTESIDPFIGPVPSDFKADWVVGEVSYRKPHKLPEIEAMSSFPANANPFHYDHGNMGCNVSGGWYAMYNEHAGTDRDGKPYRDPKYIIMVNSRTGQRFRLNFETGV